MDITNTLGDINIKDLSGNIDVDISGHIINIIITTVKLNYV